MSDYELEIKLDDSKLQRQLEQIRDVFKASGSGGSTQQQIVTGFGAGGKAAGEITDRLDRMRKLWEDYGSDVKNIASSALQLVGIGTSIGGIFALLTQASPMLSAQVKLLEQMFMLVLRPFGNILGSVIRPVLLLLLKDVILPFNRFMKTIEALVNPPTPIGIIKSGDTTPKGTGGSIGGDMGVSIQEDNPILAELEKIKAKLLVFFTTLGTWSAVFATLEDDAQKYYDKLTSESSRTFGALNENTANELQSAKDLSDWIDTTFSTSMQSANVFLSGLKDAIDKTFGGLNGGVATTLQMAKNASDKIDQIAKDTGLGAPVTIMKPKYNKDVAAEIVSAVQKNPAAFAGSLGTFGKDVQRGTLTMDDYMKIRDAIAKFQEASNKFVAVTKPIIAPTGSEMSGSELIKTISEQYKNNGSSTLLSGNIGDSIISAFKKYREENPVLSPDEFAKKVQAEADRASGIYPTNENQKFNETDANTTATEDNTAVHKESTEATKTSAQMLAEALKFNADKLAEMNASIENASKFVASPTAADMLTSAGYDTTQGVGSLLMSQLGGNKNISQDELNNILSGGLSGINSALTKAAQDAEKTTNPTYIDASGHVQTVDFGNKASVDAYTKSITGAASGHEGLVKKPTLFLAGEAGDEYVSITPVNKMKNKGKLPFIKAALGFGEQVTGGGDMFSTGHSDVMKPASTYAGYIVIDKDVYGKVYHILDKDGNPVDGGRAPDEVLAVWQTHYKPISEADYKAKRFTSLYKDSNDLDLIGYFGSGFPSLDLYKEALTAYNDGHSYKDSGFTSQQQFMSAYANHIHHAYVDPIKSFSDSVQATIDSLSDTHLKDMDVGEASQLADLAKQLAMWKKQYDSYKPSMAFNGASWEDTSEDARLETQAKINQLMKRIQDIEHPEQSEAGIAAANTLNQMLSSGKLVKDAMGYYETGAATTTSNTVADTISLLSSMLNSGKMSLDKLRNFMGLGASIGGKSWDPNTDMLQEYAQGGLINERIFGIGKSGRRYVFGEKGTEVVTPTNRGASGNSVKMGDITIKLADTMNVTSNADIDAAVRKGKESLRDMFVRAGIV